MARKRRKTVQPYNPENAHVRFGAQHLRERLALFKGLMLRRAIRKDCSAYHFEVRPDGTAFVSATDLENRMRVNLDVLHRGVSSNGTENWNKGRYAARSSRSLGSRSGRSCPCRIDSFRANSYRPSTLTWSNCRGESRSTSSGLTATSVARTLVRAASR